MITSIEIKKLRHVFDRIRNICYNKNNKDYKNYGAKNISICYDWIDSFKKFHEWSLQNGFEKDLTLDRIDLNKNFSPTNCRWVSRKNKNILHKNNNYF